MCNQKFTALWGHYFFFLGWGQTDSLRTVAANGQLYLPRRMTDGYGWQNQYTRTKACGSATLPTINPTRTTRLACARTQLAIIGQQPTVLDTVRLTNVVKCALLLQNFSE
jgi:hypothetical protein